MQTSPAVEQIKTLKDPRVRGISPVRWSNNNSTVFYIGHGDGETTQFSPYSLISQSPVYALRVFNCRSAELYTNCLARRMRHHWSKVYPNLLHT